MNVGESEALLILEESSIHFYAKVGERLPQAARFDMKFSADGIDVRQRGLECAALRVKTKGILDDLNIVFELDERGYFLPGEEQHERKT